MNKDSLDKYKQCMKYNLDINIDDIEVKLGLESKDQPKIELIEINSDEKIEKSKNIKKINININTKKERHDSIMSDASELIDDNENDLDSDEKDISKRAKIRLSWSFFFSDLNEILFLSFHNIILIIIIIISMMVSGLLSLSYIIFSLYFILTSNRMYLGEKYLYPKAIKKVLRVIIIIDIALQILYQNPFISKETGEKNILLTILNIIGFNRIINYEKSKKDDIVINGEQLLLVFCKAITYFFIGIQILIYSTQKFQEYYLIYIVTFKKNLKRKALMNAFRFNNKRIETMDQSIQLRQDMPLNMEKLKIN